MLSVIRLQQAAIWLTLADAEAVLISPGDLDLAGRGDIRTRLSAQLKAYTRFKHEIVFPTLLASSDPVVAQLSARMRSRCDAMADFYRHYLADWPVARVVEQKALYRGVALDVIGRLRQHLMREEADVVRLTERQPPIVPIPIMRHARSGF